MNIGIDFSTFESHDQAYANSWSMLPAGFAPDRSAVEPPPVSMQRPNPAFGLYYDNETSQYKMRDPLVVAEDGSEVTCSVPSQYEPGKTYYCEVVWKGGSYSAKVTADPSEEPAPPEKLVWRVKLFVVPTSSAEPSYQFHTGAITVSASDPCRIDSISDATWNGSLPEGVEYSGMDMTVEYTKTGNGCVDGTNSFTIPILRTKGADFSMDISDEVVTGTQDHPSGGVKVTLSPSAGQGTDFTVWNGKDGSPGAPGAPGAPGDPGLSIVSASSGDPSQDGDYTVTPITFVDDAGNNIGPVDVKAKNGSTGISGVQIKFDRGGNKKLEYSTDGGQSWILIAETVALSSLV